MWERSTHNIGRTDVVVSSVKVLPAVHVAHCVQLHVLAQEKWEGFR